MQAITARGTDAERTEEAAPVAVEKVEVDATGRVVVGYRDVGMEVICEVVVVPVLLLFPVERITALLIVTTVPVAVAGMTDTDGLVRSDGRDDGSGTLAESLITFGNDSVPWPSPDGITCGSAMATAATARSVKR